MPNQAKVPKRQLPSESAQAKASKANVKFISYSLQALIVAGHGEGIQMATPGKYENNMNTNRLTNRSRAQQY